MRNAILAIAIFAAWASNAYAWLETITIDPPEPAVGDSVSVTVLGYMPDTCWDLIDQSCWDVAEQEIRIDAFTYDSAGRPTYGCGLVLVPYTVTCTYEMVAPGPCIVRAYEFCDSLSPCYSNSMTAVIDVQNIVLSDGLTWAALKSQYR